MADAPDSKSGGVTPVWVQVPPSVLISTMYPVITAPGSTSARPHQDPAQSASNAPCAFSRSFCPPEVAQHDTCRQGHLLSTTGPPRHFFLSFLRFSIVTNYCTYTLYLLTITKATTNIVKRCENVPQKPRLSPNAGFAIRPTPPILMRWPWLAQSVNQAALKRLHQISAEMLLAEHLNAMYMTDSAFEARICALPVE